MVLIIGVPLLYASYLHGNFHAVKNINYLLNKDNNNLDDITDENNEITLINSTIASNILNVQQKVNEEIGNKIKQEEEAKLAAEAQAKLESEQQQAQQSQKNTSVESDSLANASGLTSNSPKESSSNSSVSNQSFAAQLNVANQTDQIVIVKGNGGSSATVSLHKKINGIWNEILSTDGNVGLNGITNNKHEGDKMTPAGVYSFGTAFGIGGNPGTSLPYRQINNNDYWVDDSNSSHYNQWVNTSNTPQDWNSAEHLISYQSQYAYGIVVNYNTSCTPGLGSAIFFHCSTGNGTYGCISVPESVLVSIMQSINSNCLIVIAIGDNIYNY